MAKMFYTMDEVCEKLGRTEDDVKEMVSSGQIQEFRDRDRLMFKVEQIDLLAHDEDTGEVHLDLEDTGGGSAIGLTDSGIPLMDSREATGLSGSQEATGLGLAESREATGLDLIDESREGTGISVFDTGHGEEPGEGTHVGETIGEDDLSLEAVGSGSGLLDLTRESDDTSLGAELLEEVYSGEENIEIPANASGLFEAAGAETMQEEVAAASSIAAMPMVIESYDGAGSGLGVGVMLGAIAALVCIGIMVVVALFGATPQLSITFADKLWIWAGGLLGITVVFGLIGLFIGKSSE
jgi:hypothetical protein